jgi:hypothetical protein
MDARERRLAANETTFRELNERIEAAARRHGEDAHVYAFVCECSNTDCTLKIELSLAEYEAVRAHSARFAVAKGHALPEVETVVDAHEGYDVVEKEDAAADYAEAHDPRS